MDTDKPMPAPQPWVPIESPIDLKHLGKLIEECGELTSAASRCIIQGLDESHPETGKVNWDWLREELADVLANIELNVEHFKIDTERLYDRVLKKKEHLRAWHNALPEKPVKGLPGGPGLEDVPDDYRGPRC